MLEGLDEITSKTDDIQSLEASISTVFIEELAAIISGNLSVSEKRNCKNFVYKFQHVKADIICCESKYGMQINQTKF